MYSQFGDTTLDLDRLCWRLGTDRLHEVANNLEVALATQIAQERVNCEPCWTESLAVGSASFVERIRPLIVSRQQTELEQPDADLWVLQESAIPYGTKMEPKTACKGQN